MKVQEFKKKQPRMAQLTRISRVADEIVDASKELYQRLNGQGVFIGETATDLYNHAAKNLPPSRKRKKLLKAIAMVDRYLLEVEDWALSIEDEAEETLMRVQGR